MSEGQSAEKRLKGNLVNVGPWMPAIRRRARVVVIAEQLRELDEELSGGAVSLKSLERIRALRELVKGL